MVLARYIDMFYVAILGSSSRLDDLYLVTKGSSCDDRANRNICKIVLQSKQQGQKRITPAQALLVLETDSPCPATTLRCSVLNLLLIAEITLDPEEEVHAEQRVLRSERDHPSHSPPPRSFPSDYGLSVADLMLHFVVFSEQHLVETL